MTMLAWSARAWLLLILLATTPWGPARALDASRAITQFHHTSWTIEDGAPADIWALAQTPDGFLWLGTGEGLYRFDGVRFEPFAAAPGEQLAASNINALLAATNGDLWIGYSTGAVSRLRSGHLTSFAPLFGRASVHTLVEASDGKVWAALGGDGEGGIARFEGSRWHRLGAAENLTSGPIWGLVAAPDQTIYAATSQQLIVMRSGSHRFVSTGITLAYHTRIAQDRDGRVWMFRGPVGASPLQLAGPAAFHTFRSGRSESVDLSRAIFDRDGSLWASEEHGGLVRVRVARAVKSGHGLSTGQMERFSVEQRLSSSTATPLLEDREGNVWVGTNRGLDRFRSANTVTETRLPVDSRGYQADFVGSDLIVATDVALYRCGLAGPAQRIGLLPSKPFFVRTDRSGIVWIGLADRLLRYEAGRLTQETLPARRPVTLVSWMQLPSGEIRVAVADSGVFERRAGRWRRVNFGAGLPPILQMQPDTSGFVWIADGERLVRLRAGEQSIFSRAEGLDVGGVQIVAVTGKKLLVGGDYGVAQFDGRRFQTLSSRDYPVLSRVSGIVEGADGSLWLNGIAGVVHVAAGALDEAVAHPERRLRYTLFNLADGLSGVAQQDGGTPTALRGPDDRIWFVTNHGLAWIDPAHLTRNRLPPPVVIRGVTADGRFYAADRGFKLPAGTSSLQIDYTALSLSVPERVQFRYRLEGVDQGWVNPGARRQAFYTRLVPGTYVFQVRATNNDGVWNQAGARVAFVVPPTFVQSWVFKALCTGLVVAAVWLLYSVRLRQMGARLRIRLEERVAERERIARELHDTLLQGFQGLVLRFEAVSDAIPARQPAHALMQQALDRADNVLVEARNRVIDLRSTVEDADLAQLFAATAQRLSVEPRIRFRVVAEGASRRLHPLVRDEIGRIFEEALVNVLQHSRANSAEATVSYLRRELRVTLRDDGVGIDPGVLALGGRENHFGLTGMRERAGRIGADLELTSRIGGGTEIAVSIAARLAYVRSRPPPRRPVLGWWRAVRGWDASSSRSRP